MEIFFICLINLIFTLICFGLILFNTFVLKGNIRYKSKVEEIENKGISGFGR